MTGRFLFAVGLIVTTALAMAWGAGGRAEATTFNPFFGPPDFYRLDPTTPGAYSDIHAQFNILPPSANFSPHFGGLITFGDSDVYVANAAGVPGTGAYVGRLQSTATLGLANEGCDSQVPVTFELVEASTDTTAWSIDTPPGDGNPATSDDPLLLNGAITSGATTLVYTGASGTDPLGKRVSDNLPINIIQIDSEKMLLTDVDYSTNTYTVTRGWEGTAVAAHAARAEIKRVNIIFPSGPNDNLLANMAEDDGDMDNNVGSSTNNTDGHGHAPVGGIENADYGTNQVADGADAVPSFVRDSLDPNVNANDGGYVQARARYQGVAFVANTLIVMLQYVVMDPGALTVFPNLQWATAAWGFPSVTFLQDPLAPPSNSAISDFCNFSANTFLLGTPHDNACTGVLPPPSCTGAGANFTLRLAVDGGCPGSTTPNECGTACAPNCAPPCDPGACYRQKNPMTPQRVRFYQYAASQRDYDNDGVENGLDPCPNVPNSGWDPRANNTLSGQDADGDGLPAACDPNDAAFNNDEDGDGWQNRMDNCPLVYNAAPNGGGGAVPNTFQFDRDVPPGQDVPDAGPPSDDIGPACDTPANSCGGCPALTPTGANGHYHTTYAAQTICLGPPTSDCDSAPEADADGDGVVNANDTCINGANPPFTFGPGAVPGSTTLSAPAHRGDSTIVAGGSTAGWVTGQPIVISSPLETLRYITTSAPGTISFTPPLSYDHPTGAPVRMVSFARSVRDMNNDGFVDISDVSLLEGVFGSQGGNPWNDGVGDSAVPGYQGRYDTNYDSFIDITDVSSLTGMFGAACGPP